MRFFYIMKYKLLENMLEQKYLIITLYAWLRSCSFLFMDAVPGVWLVSGTIANHPSFLLVNVMSGDGGLLFSYYSV